MLFAIDIDGTIAQDKHGHAYAHYLNQTLHLNIANETINQLPNYHAFFNLPAVQTFTQDNPSHQEQFAKALQTAQYDLGVHQAVTPMPDAAQAVKMLLQEGQIIYTTCRKPESRAITQEWLEKYQFPEPEQVFFCNSQYHKCIHAYEAAEQDQSIILIDDHAIDIIRGFKKLAYEKPNIALAALHHFAFIMFGTHTVPDFPLKQKFRITAIPSWNVFLAQSAVLSKPART